MDINIRISMGYTTNSMIWECPKIGGSNHQKSTLLNIMLNYWRVPFRQSHITMWQCVYLHVVVSKSIRVLPLPPVNFIWILSFQTKQTWTDFPCSGPTCRWVCIELATICSETLCICIYISYIYIYVYLYIPICIYRHIWNIHNMCILYIYAWYVYM